MNEKQNVQSMWKVLKKFQKPLQRQIFEAKTIANTAPNVILNSKTNSQHEPIEIEQTEKGKQILPMQGV